ncbi:MAG TPA: hypothetical protein VNY07_15190 [Chthoniobacterales bacterium]|nr:hypothetical protein [Chthoniobacterales bacterium]
MAADLRDCIIVLALCISAMFVPDWMTHNTGLAVLYGFAIGWFVSRMYHRKFT